MSGKSATSLKELKSLREAVLAEEKAKARAIIETLPPNSTLTQREEEVIQAESDSSAALEISDIPPAAEGEASLPPATAQSPPVVRPTVMRPAAVAATPAARAKIGTKEPALIIPLTPKIQERLQRNTENSRWSSADLVIELIRASLHRGYAAIQYGDQILARAGSYRTLERNPFETVLKLVSGQGVFNLSVKPENIEFQHWVNHFTSQNAADPEILAAQLCLFALQNYLENIEDFQLDAWTKHISTDAYALESLTAPAV